MSSCEKPSLESESPDESNGPSVAAVANANQQLDDKGKNPFTVENMRQAYTNLLYPPDDCIDCPSPPPPTPEPVVQPTHLYVRFKPADVNQIADLDDLGYQLSWEPMDESVAAVTTVDYNSDVIPWVYSVVPVGTSFPSYIQREQIAQLFLFYPESGDARDVDYTEPYPTPPFPTEPCTQWDPSCNCYVRCGTASATTATVENRITDKPNKQLAATEKLKQAGISPRALYDEAMRISGHSDEAIAAQRSAPTKPGGVQAQGVRYKPSGRILVQDTDLGNVALRGVEVKSRRWFQFGSNFTDTQGNFAISTSYKNKAKIALQFKNNLATTRGIISGLRFWQAVLPIKSDLGTYAGPAMQNLAYTVTFRGGLDQAQSKGASTWTAATLFNTLADAQTYSVARGLPGPVRGINIWLFPDIPLAGGGYASTPMLRRIADTSLASRLIDNMLLNMGPLGIAKYLLKQLLQRQLPDMTVFYRGDQGALASHQLNPLLYHELGHTQHYSQVGNSFWSAFIGKIITSFGYGDKTGIEAGRVAISEGWGNYVERLFTIDKYQASVAPARARAALFELDYQVPGDYGYNWFVYGMYHDMTDSTPEPVSTVVDDVTAYTPATVFRGLQSDVSTVRSYQARVNAQNSSVQAAQLERLVTSYRW